MRGYLIRARIGNFLARTEAVYTERMGRWVRRTMGGALGDLGAHHFGYLNRLPQYGGSSPRRGCRMCTRTLAGLGLGVRAQGNIHFDTAARYVPQAAGEVHLVTKPVGGLEDYATFLHEAGHAQHFGNSDPAPPYVDRAIPTSFALTEMYAFLFQFLTTNPAWQREVAGMPEVVAPSLPGVRGTICSFGGGAAAAPWRGPARSAAAATNSLFGRPRDGDQHTLSHHGCLSP